ncbi:DUF7927 domain-containing protein [Microbacterium oxydans]
MKHSSIRQGALSVGLTTLAFVAFSAAPVAAADDTANRGPQAATSACLSFQYTFNSSPTNPLPGQAVTYQMEFINHGAIDSTKSRIDFSTAGILDDGTLSPSTLSATRGDVAIEGAEITWNGPLASGEKVTITFDAVWKGQGDGLPLASVGYYGYDF